MLRSLTLALAACALLCPPARAQTSPAPALPAESLVHAARADAELAARDQFVGGYFAATFMGGATFGLMAPIAVLIPTKETVGFAAAGGVLMLTTINRAGDPVRMLPDTTAPRLANEPLAYQEAYQAAYFERLAKRRVRAAKTGAAVGTVAGLGFFGFLVYSFANADF